MLRKDGDAIPKGSQSHAAPHPRVEEKANRLQVVHCLVAILLLSACSSNPAVISGDTSCERFRHISATPAQIKVFADNWEVMESYADSIVSHNLEYDRHCLGVAP